MLPCYKQHYKTYHVKRIGTVVFGKHVIPYFGDYGEGELLSPLELKGAILKKPYLQSPVRERVIATHRQLKRQLCTVPERVARFFTDIVLWENVKPKMTQVVPTNLEEKNMKPITLLEMIPLQFRLYKGRYIDLTIVNDTELKPGWKSTCCRG